MQHLAPLGRLALPALSVLALLLVALPVAAGQPDRIETSHASVWNGPPVLGAEAALPADGMRAAIDRRTGELRPPTVAEAFVLDALAAPAMSRVFAPVQVERADGTVMLAVDPELINYSVFRVDAAGGGAFSCVDGPARAAEIVHTAAAPAVEVK